VDSSDDFDYYIISGEFVRDGTLYANFEDGYIPSDDTEFVFATHQSSSGTFTLSHGDLGVYVFTFSTVVSISFQFVLNFIFFFLQHLR
jgi:hypothetical protein